jgi:para-aminobenzoate synthetase
MRTLLIDNYDSFTFNLFQVLAAVNREDPIVVRNDEATWAELQGLDFDNIVISPGPGRPEQAKDFGVCRDAIEAAEVPLLGVCLGHQGMAHVCGGEVVHAPEVMHGRLSPVFHDDSPLYAGIPQGFHVVRYHSLCVAQPLPECLDVTSWTADGVVMGIAHRTRPMWGVQFHPESICTNDGRQLVQNFRDLTEQVIGEAPTRLGRRPAARPSSAERAAGSPPASGERLEDVRLRVHRLDRLYDPERIFCGLFAEERNAFWLDSSKASDARSRFSFMGASGGPLSSVVTYDVATGEVRVDRPHDSEVHRESIFDYLDGELRRFGSVPDNLPFDLTCGFVGYLGYELKADCEGDLPYRSPLPDAAFVFADRLVAFDHLEEATYVVCVTDAATAEAGERWIDEVSAAIDGLPPAPALDIRPGDGEDGAVEFRLSRSHEAYIADINRCKDHLTEGDTYEVCLTNRVWADADLDPLELYRILRHINPAPFSSLLRFGDVAVMSSSPERFLKVHRDGWAEAKPIKGTCSRGRDAEEDRRLSDHLRTDEKSRAENLMITDLLRNDLGIVCEIGTVHVPHLMEVETYQTVHQLVSTVAGHLRADVSAPECIRACFPGGSMTGAPKKRTMEIIDDLEKEPRGVYSGAIGYLGLSGAADLSIVIRTIVSDPTTTSIGTGGAIIMQSDAEDEYEEILLKAAAPMRAIRLCADSRRRREAQALDEAAGGAEGTADRARSRASEVVRP